MIVVKRIKKQITAILFVLFTLSSANAAEHLFILSGQSNMYNLDPNLSFTPALANAFGEDNIVIVKDAWSAQPILRWYKKWQPAEGTYTGTTGDLYDRLMQTVDIAIAGKAFKTVTFVWMQGERDAREGYGEVYAASLRGLIDQLTGDLERDHINFVIGRISDYDIAGLQYPHWNMVRGAQIEVAEADSRGAWVDTDDLNDTSLGDDIHYTPEGYRMLGERFAEKAIALIEKEISERPAAPQNLSIVH